jgi:hypothetical protein
MRDFMKDNVTNLVLGIKLDQLTGERDLHLVVTAAAKTALCPVKCKRPLSQSMLVHPAIAPNRRPNECASSPSQSVGRHENISSDNGERKRRWDVHPLNSVEHARQPKKKTSHFDWLVLFG